MKHPAKIIALVAAALAVAVGALALVGWAFDIAVLKSIRPDWVSMKPNTALCFILMGIGLLLSGPRLAVSLQPSALVSRLARLCALLAGLIGLLSLAEYAFGWNLGFDQWLFLEPAGAVGTSHPGRMAPDTAICFALLAVGLEVIRRVSRTITTSIAGMTIGALVMSVALIEILSYFTPSLRTYGWGGLTMMALPTALLFAALGVALGLRAQQDSRAEPEPATQPEPESDSRTGIRLLLILFFVAAGVVSTGVYYYRGFERQYRAGVEIQLSSIANLKVSELVQYRNERRADAQLLYKNAAISALVRRFFEKPGTPGAQRQLQAWLGKLEEHYQYDQVRLLDVQGVTRLSSPVGLPAVSGSVARTVLEDVRAGQIMFQDFYRPENDQQIYFGVLIPVLDEQDGDRPLGLLYLRVNAANYIFPFIRRWPTSSTSAETLLVRREGNEVVFLSELRFRKNAALNLRRPLSETSLPAVQAVLGREGIVSGTDYRGVEVMSALRKIPDSPWFLVARMDTAEVLFPIQERLWQVVAVIVVLLYGAGAGVALLWRRQREKYYRAKLEAEAERSKLGAIVDSSEDAIIGNTLEGGITSWNRGAERCYGYMAAEMIGQSLSRLFPPDRMPEFEQLLELIRNGKSVSHLESECVHMDGRRIRISLSLSPVRDRNGTLVGGAAISRDITVLKLAEESLRASEAKFRQLHESLMDGFCRVGMDGRIQDFNRVFQAMVGYTDDEIRRATYAELTPEKWHDVEARIVAEQILTHGYSDVYEKEYCRKDGTIIPVELRTFLLSGADGKPAGMWAIVRDIKDRKEAERTLRESERTHRLLIQNLHAGVVVHAPDTHILIANEQASVLLGLSIDQLMGKTSIDPDWRFLREDETPMPLAEFPVNQVLATRQPLRDLVVGANRPNTHDRAWALVNAFPEFDDQRQLRQVVVTFVDITSRKAAEEALQRSELRYRKFFEKVPLAICHLTPEGVIDFRNGCFNAAFGYTEQEIPTAQAWWPLAYPDPAYRQWVTDTWTQGVQRAKETASEIPTVEYRVTCKSGEVRNFEISGISLEDDNILVTFVDVTERKRSEQVMRTVSAYNRSLLEASLDPLVTISAEGKITDVNTASAHATGLPREQLIGADFSDYFTEPAEARKGYEQVFAEGFVRDYPLAIRHASGRITEVLYNASVYRDEQGVVVGVFAAARDVTQLKRAEKALSEGKQRLEMASAAGNVALWEWDLASGRLEWSGGIDQMLGYGNGKFPRTIEAWSQTLHPDDVARVTEALNRHLRGEAPYNLDYRARRADGTYIWWLVTGMAARDAAGKAVRMTGSCVDVTLRKRAEQELRLKNLVFDESIAANSIADLNGVITECNDAFLEIWNYPSKDEVVGKSITHFFDVQDDAIAAVSALDELGQWEGDFTARKRDGSTFLAYAFATVVRGENGKVIGYQSTVSDVTERKLAEQALREEQARYRALFEQSPYAVLVMDAKTTLPIMFNDVAPRQLGYSRKEFAGLRVSDFEAAETPEVTQARIGRLLREGRDDFETRHHTKTGELRNVQVTVQTIELSGRPAFHCIFRDITERKQAEEEIRQLNADLERRVHERTAELEASNRELEAFSYSVSHDLRAPLRSISGFSSIVLEDYSAKLDDEGRDSLNRIHTAAQRMAQLIDDLLSLSKVTRTDMHWERVDLSKLVHEVASELRRREPARVVELTVADGLFTLSDARLLRIVLENLLGNAWKFTGKCAQARIEFGAANGNQPQAFFVRDNGAGFDEAHAGKLFGAFQRLHSAEEFPGTGIGLATVQRIVHRHGGRVWAEGKVGAGATFYFSLKTQAHSLSSP